MNIVAIANQKGGTGKTTSTLALGAALAARGRHVLLVDLDPQASLTSAGGVTLDEQAPTVYTLIAHYLREHEACGLDAQVHRLEPGLDLLPASIDLAVAELELQNAVRREYVLAEVLAPACGYDLVLIDCPPSLSLLTVNALTAATDVVIPLVPEYLAARGLGLLLESIGRVRKSKLNPHLRVAGVILTMVDYRATHSRETREQIETFLNGTIPILGDVKRSVKVAEASAAGMSMLRYAARSESAQAYDEVAARLLRLWGLVANNSPAAAVRHG